MSEKNTLDLTEGGATDLKIVPYLRLTVTENTYSLGSLVTVPANYAVGECAVNSSGATVTVNIPVTSSGTSEHWKAVLRTCTLPDIGGGITTNSTIVVNVNDVTSVTGDAGGGDPPGSQGSSQVTYEDAEDE